MKNIILTSRIFPALKEALQYASAHNYYGVELYLDKIRLALNPHRMEEVFNKLNRYPQLFYAIHLPTTDVEIGHKVSFYAKTSLQYLMMYIDFLKPWLLKQDHQTVFTLHIGANSLPMELLNWKTCQENLKKLGQYVASVNGCLCLENVKAGWTADPERLIELVEYAGINITFDTGHAVSSPLIREGKITFAQYISKLKPYITYIHFYAYETLKEGKHMPPESWEDIKIIWEEINKIEKVKGITLELTTLPELEFTFNLLTEYGNMKKEG